MNKCTVRFFCTNNGQADGCDHGKAVPSGLVRCIHAVPDTKLGRGTLFLCCNLRACFADIVSRFGEEVRDALREDGDGAVPITSGFYWCEEDGVEMVVKVYNDDGVLRVFNTRDVDYQLDDLVVDDYHVKWGGRVGGTRFKGKDCGCNCCK